MLTQMFKKMLVTMIICSALLVPNLAVASSGQSSAPVVAGVGDDMALLKVAVGEGASLEAAALASDEMRAIEGARRWRTPKWVKDAVKVVVITIAVVAVVHGVAGATAVAY